MVLVIPVLILLFSAIPAAARPVDLAFEPNLGQTHPKVQFLTRGRGYGLFLAGDEAVIRFTSPKAGVVRMKFPGQNRNPRAEGIERVSGTTNYLRGSGRASATGIPHYNKVRYSEVYPGIDLVYYGHERLLEYDFVAKPGSDPNRIRIAFSGAASPVVDSSGDLVIQTSGEPIIQKKPRVYQEIEGLRRTIDAAYVVSDSEVRFKLGSYDKTQPLVIDPVLVYSTYLGGTGAGDQGNSIAVDASGSVYVAGQTTSTDFPIAGAAQGASGGGLLDALVLKLDPSGTQVVYATYIGGSSVDEAHSIAVDAGGNAYITGYTTSPNFPVVNGFQRTRAGAEDGYFLKLSSSGSTILFSTYLGGSSDDRGIGIALDPGNNIYIAGRTGSNNFPSENAYQRAAGGGFADIFVTKLSPANSVVYSTYVGGIGNDQPLGIAVDGIGAAYVTGFTTSLNFPLVNALQSSFGLGTDDAFVFKLNPAGTGLEYSTYLGGIGSDNGVRIAVDATGSAYVTGMTTSVNFPTAKAYQFLPAGEADAFLSRLSPDGKSLVFSTFFGGFQTDSGTGIALDRTGNVYIAGFTTSFDLPTANEVQGFIGGDRDAYIAKFMPDGSTIMFATFLGGLGPDAAVGVAVDAAENIYVTGLTSSDNFPTVTPIQAAIATGQDLFVAKISAKDIVASSQFNIASQGLSSVITRGTRTDPVFGYATAEPVSPNARLTGLAIVKSKQNGAIVSEVGVPAPKLTEAGRVFVDFTESARSVISLANPSDQEATVDFFFTDENGTTSNFATVTIAPHHHFSRFVTDDPLLVRGPGTLNFTSSIPVAATAFRTYSNETGEFLLSYTPIVNPLQVTSGPVTIPQLAEGAGWSTEVVLVNPSEETMNGEVHFVSQGSGTEPGAALEVGIGDGTSAASVLEYDIPPRSFRRVSTAGNATRSEVQFAGRAGSTFRTPGVGGVQISGFAAAEPTDPNIRLNGLQVIEYRQLGITQSEFGLIAPSQRQSGRLFVESTDKVRTMLALANPNPEDAAVDLTLIDETGTAGTPVSVTVPAGGQYSAFLSEQPVSLALGSARTLSYSSTVPIFASAIRFVSNERSDSLLTSVPIADPAKVERQTVTIPRFTNGAGWTSQIILVNPTDTGITGEVRFGVTVGTGLGTASVFEYTIPPGSFKRIETNGSADEANGVADALAAGPVAIVPSNGTAAPHAHAVIAQRVGDNTIFQTSILGQGPASNLRFYAESAGDFEAGTQKAVRTAVALANPSDLPVTVRLELTSLDGAALGTSGPIQIQGNSHVAMFLNQAPGFASLPRAFQAVLRVNVTAGGGVAATVLRALVNQRADILFTSTGPLEEEAGLPGRLVFPYMTDGTGYTTQFIMLNPPGAQNVAGVLRFLAQDATGLQVDVLRLGSVRIQPFFGFNTPHAHAILTHRESGVITFQTFVDGQVPDSGYRFYSEAIGDFDSGINGSTRSTVAIANPSAAPVSVRLELTGLDGRLAAASRLIEVPANGEISMFVHQAPGLERVPLPFQGILRVRTACDPAPQCRPSPSGITAVGMRGIYNERGNVIFTTTGPLVEDAGAPEQLVFPHIAEGGGYTTQFIVISAPSGPSSSGTLRFFNQEGNPLSVTLTDR